MEITTSEGRFVLTAAAQEMDNLLYLAQVAAHQQYRLSKKAGDTEQEIKWATYAADIFSLRTAEQGLYECALKEKRP